MYICMNTKKHKRHIKHTRSATIITAIYIYINNTHKTHATHTDNTHNTFKHLYNNKTNNNIQTHQIIITIYKYIQKLTQTNTAIQNKQLYKTNTTQTSTNYNINNT